MSSPNKNWQRWVIASIAKHFETKFGGEIHLYMENEDRQTEGQEHYCELRVDGPSCDQLSPTTYRLDLTIDALVVSIKSSRNGYTHEDKIGLVSSAFTTGIPVFRYGIGVDDDQTELGCLQLLPDVGKDKIVVTRFGQTVPYLRLQEATIEAEYRMLVTQS